MLMLVIIWPIFAGYMEWISMWVSGVKVGEVYKKALVMMIAISTVIISNRVLYTIIVGVGIYGITSVVALRVYG